MLYTLFTVSDCTLSSDHVISRGHATSSYVVCRGFWEGSVRSNVCWNTNEPSYDINEVSTGWREGEVGRRRHGEAERWGGGERKVGRESGSWEDKHEVGRGGRWEQDGRARKRWREWKRMERRAWRAGNGERMEEKFEKGGGRVTQLEVRA